MNIFQQLENEFGDSLSTQDNFTKINISKDVLREKIFILKSKYKLDYFVDHFVEDLGNSSTSSDLFRAYYQFYSLEHAIYVLIVVEINDGQCPGLREIIPSIGWYEREMHDLFGVQYDTYARGIPSLLIPDHINEKTFLNCFNPNGDLTISEIENFKTKSQKSVLDIQSDSYIGHISLRGPHSQGTYDIVCEIEEDKIISARPRAGFVHRGIEKQLQTIKYQFANHLLERLNFNSAFINSELWIQLVEKVLKITPTDYTMAARMVFIEFARISDHLQSLASMCYEVGATDLSNDLYLSKEMIHEIYEKCSGHRFTMTLNRIGGLSKQLPKAWVSSSFEVLFKIENVVASTYKKLVRSRGWMEMTKRGIINASEAVKIGASGPTLRATGINFDLRKQFPFYFYDDIDFEIPLGVYGSSYDRFLVRVEEILQSIRIISQVLDNFPATSHVTESFLDRFFNYHQTNELDDRIVKSNYVINEAMCIPEGIYVHHIESSNGLLGMTLISDGKESPKRVKIKAPSFDHFQTFSKISIGLNPQEVRLALNSVNINSSEMDR